MLRAKIKSAFLDFPVFSTIRITRNKMQSRIKVQSILTLLIAFLFTSSAFGADKPRERRQNTQAKAATLKDTDSTFNYLIKGKPVPPWKLVIGNKYNWYIELNNLEGETQKNGLVVSRANRRTKGDAISAKWSGKTMSQLYLLAEKVDLKAAENIAELIIELRVDKRPNKKVFVRMGCKNACQGEIDYSKIIRGLPVGKWQVVTIPLNCLAQAGADLSRVDSPLQIATEGRFALSIANVLLNRLPPGVKGCSDK